jgi:hypothetical protein
MGLVLVAITLTPVSAATVPWLGALVLCGNLAATFVAFATEGLMAHNAGPGGRGRAGGWVQSGNQFGQTAGGGLGLWLMQHLAAPWMAGAVLALLVAACAMAPRGLDEPPPTVTHGGVADRGRDAWRELRAVLASHGGRIRLLLATLPIGTGAAQFLFGSLGPEGTHPPMRCRSRWAWAAAWRSRPAAWPAAGWRPGCRAPAPTPRPVPCRR